MSGRKLLRRWKSPTAVVVIALQLIQSGCIRMTNDAGLLEQTDNFTGNIDFTTDKPTAFDLTGTEPTLGDYTAHGEVTFHPGDADGKFVGEGVAVFTLANGDQLVAVVTWPVDAEVDQQRAGQIEFHWRDSVVFSDGSSFDSTGEFADAANRPPGLVVIAIIAILIGLLVPAVQK